LLLAQRARRVIAVDNSQKMVEYGSELIRRNAVANCEYRLGDMEELPLAPAEVDLVLMHQTLHHVLHPEQAMAEAWRVTRAGGRIVILDLLKHECEAARELYGDVWLGFSQVELCDLLRQAGFEEIEVAVVFREEEAPHFQTVLAMAQKPL
jgi:ArsR family transcriptional regulator